MKRNLSLLIDRAQEQKLALMIAYADRETRHQAKYKVLEISDE